MNYLKLFLRMNSLTGRWIAMVLLIFLHLGFSSAALAQSGVVAWKEQPFHSDSTAKVFYFDRMERTGTVTWFFRDRKRIVLEANQAFDVVLVPGSLAELDSKVGTPQLQKDYDELSAFATKYPAAGTLLEMRLKQMETYLANEKATIETPAGWVSVAKYDKANAESSDSEGSQPIYRIEVYVVCAIYLLVLIGFTLWRKRTPVLLLLILPFIGGFGWMTYKEQGLGWIQRVTEELRELYQKTNSP
ncbi:MAG: hypothetical protein ACRCXD_02325 [Luteolibacter sp.]